ncbi:hypothetical protein GCM10007384_30830 [Aquimarina muelleri]|uniref:Uncharacterized protein n=2 Tax=Aquimarina muelleri TaxID=279356 RepID=A0A918JY46_9FLAO|nr:hypothetical protein GCM10007384_30830 [Aquimarina muelleri]
MLFTYVELISNNTSAQEYFLGKVKELKQEDITIDLFDNGIVSLGSIKPWGFYDVLTTKSIFKKDTIIQVALIGQKRNKDTIALYLTDNNKALFMVEKAKITGDVFLPKAGIKAGYITASSYRKDNFLLGSKKNSRTKLPNMNTSVFTYEPDEAVRVTFEDITSTSMYYNSYANKTIVIEVDEITIRNKKLSGNIILESRDSIYIKKNNEFEDIIIKAPKVVFEKGFKGNVQVIAEDIVELEENVVLMYPSGIMMSEKRSNEKEVILKKDSKILGAIVVYDKDNNVDKKITIDEKAEVVGTVFCNGKVQLKGTVFGTVYTNNFYLKTEGSIYDNYIMNGIIDRKSLPDFFIGISLFQTQVEQLETYAIIKSI